MAEWLASNAVTVIALLVVIIIVSLALWSVFRGRKKKNGAEGCGGKCSSCPYGGGCSFDKK